MPVLGLHADPPLDAWPERGVVAILDLEYTSWDGAARRMWNGPQEWREIVQIGTLLADAAKGYREIAAFEAFVSPERNPVLSDYFIRLTGIKQADLDARAEPFESALRRLCAFIASAQIVLFNGNDGEILRENCAMRGIDCPVTGFNFRPLLARTLGRPSSELTSSDLPAIAGLKFEGRAHSALADCRGIAAAFGAWMGQGQLAV